MRLYFIYFKNWAFSKQKAHKIKEKKNDSINTNKRAKDEENV